MDERVYNEFLRLRQKLKDEGRCTQGYAPVAGSNDVLIEIAELCLEKLSDFQGVSEGGRMFVENYGEVFVAGSAMIWPCNL